MAIRPASADCTPYLQELARNTSMTDERRKTMLHVSWGGDEREILNIYVDEN